MRASNFGQLLKSLRRLTVAQLEVLKEAVGKQETDVRAVNALAQQRLDANAACPSCKNGSHWKWGVTSAGQPRLRCRGCKATFTALTGTGFGRLRDKGRLIDNAACMAQGLSVKQTALRLEVTRRTAYRLRKQFLPTLAKHQPAVLAGSLEADETFFRRSYKGQRTALPRESYERGTPASKRGISSEQVAVLTVMSRASRDSFIAILPGVPSAKSVGTALAGRLAPGSTLCTDGTGVYAKVAPTGIEVRAAPAREHASGNVHVQTVNALHSRMKSWMRNFKGVATKNLDSYLAAFRFFDRDSSKEVWPGFVGDAFGVPHFNT